MDIQKTEVNDLNAVLKIDITAEDYQPKVDKVLKKYQATANEPGFRKGKMPIQRVKQKYGKAVLFEEVNKILQESVNKYIVDEKLDILGYPIPVPQDNINWEDEKLSFEFELGLAPKFEIAFPKKNKIKNYKIVTTDKNIEEYVTNLRRSYGAITQKTEVTDTCNIKGIFTEFENGEQKEGGIKHTANFKVDTIKGAKNKKIIKAAKVGDVLKLKSKNLFEDVQQLATNLGKSVEEVEKLNVELAFKVEEINEVELSELNQELFDKVYGKDVVKSEEELKNKIKDEMEQMYNKEAENYLYRQIQDTLIDNTKIELPKEFLKKWIAQNSKEPLSPEKVEEEFTKSEKNLKYQLIESKLVKENELQVKLEDIKAFAKDTISKQMLQFGQQPDNTTIEQITQGILQNKEEVNRISEQIMSSKIMNTCKEKIQMKENEVSFDEFIKLLSKK